MDGETTIRRCTVAEVMGAPEFPTLVDEYAAECKALGLPAPDAKLTLYRRLESSGAIFSFGAFHDGRLIGFISILVSPPPHYGTALATCESYFVTAAWRGTAGLRLLASAEALAREKRSPVLLLSAPSGGRLAELLPKCGYTECSRVFVRTL